MKMISAENLTFRYNNNSKIVLNDLCFSCEKGTINVLLGLNGSGKTTLIKILAGLLEKYQGQIILDDKNLKGISIKERSKIMAYVSQRSGLIDDFLVEDYLLFGKVNKLSFYQSPTEDDKKRALEYAEKLEITCLLDKKLGEISGGERQIVSICGALIQDTNLIVLDEPTSALDIKNQHKVLSILKGIAKNENKTIILSSHNPNHALYLESNVLLLKDGKIAVQGQANDVITLDCLKMVYGDDICYSNELSYKEISFKD